MLFPKLPELPENLPWHTNAYLLVDGVSVPELSKRLYEWYPAPEFELLYLSTPLAELLDISPCLVGLQGLYDSGLTVFLEQENSEWGYLIFSDAQPAALLEHLRNLLTARHPQGQSVYLRVADPAVMAALLTLAEHEQSNHLHGPIDEFVIADKLHNRWRVFRGDASARGPIRAPYQLSETQLDALSEVSFRSLVVGLAEHIQAHFPDYLTRTPLERRWQHVQSLAEQAYALGFSSEIEITHFANIFGLLGDDALEQHNDIAKLVYERSTQTPAQRIEQAAQIARLRAQQILPAPEQHMEGVVL